MAASFAVKCPNPVAVGFICLLPGAFNNVIVAVKTKLVFSVLDRLAFQRADIAADSCFAFEILFSFVYNFVTNFTAAAENCDSRKCHDERGK